MSMGLVLGKFAPLHKGHQRLIEASLAETDRTVVLIYDCADLDTPPLQVRSNWIRTLYPTVELLEAWDGPTETGLDTRVTQMHDAYLRKRLGDRRITHFFSSEPYGEHVSRGLGAVDRRIDSERQSVPISATQIRENLWNNRQYLSTIVYRDLITHVVFLGAPSTGKTTLACELANRYQTVWMPEYGREYWEQHQSERRLSCDQLLEIALEHRRREDTLVEQANRFLFIDTDATTTLQFSNYYHDRAHPQLIALANEARQRYDLFFVCAPDIPYDDTWDRSGDANRMEMHRRIVGDLSARKTPFHLLTGSVDQRCKQVEAVLTSAAQHSQIEAPFSHCFHGETSALR